MTEFSEKGVTVGDVFISYDEIDKARNNFRFANHVLVTLEQGYGRDDYVDKFIMDKDQWTEEKRKLLKHGQVYVGEIAGKHSEVIFFPDQPGAIKEEFDLKAIVDYFNISGWGDHDMYVLERLEEDYEGD